MPHDAWARQYDFVFDECFGESFRRLTRETVRLIADIHPPPARVLELGAGTGRITLPLAGSGYDVTAIERSAAMADVLQEKATARGLTVEVRREDLREMSSTPGDVTGAPSREAEPFDLSVAIFTVFNYLVTEEDIRTVATSVARRLRPDGRLLFDLAERRLFASGMFESSVLHREIDVTEFLPDIFRYRDAASGTFQGARFQYDERFTLRYWRLDDVASLLASAGLTLVLEHSPRLRESGSRWFEFRREVWAVDAGSRKLDLEDT